MKKGIMLIIILVIFLTTVYPANWQTFKKNNQRSSLIKEFLSPPLISSWTFTIGEKILSSPIISDNIVFFGAREGSIFALDAYSGETLWQYSTSGWVDSSPVADKENVYVASRDGKIYAFKKNPQDQDPQLIWSFNTNSELASSPLIHNQKLFVLGGYPQNKLFVIDTKTGNLIKEINLSQYGFSSPAISEDSKYLIIGTNDGKYHCISLNDYFLKWSFQTKSDVRFLTPAIWRGYVFIPSGADDFKTYCLGILDGIVCWQTQDLVSNYMFASSVATSSDTIIVNIGYNVGSGVDKLEMFSIKIDNGSVKWKTYISTPHPSGIVPSPIVCGDFIYTGSGDGQNTGFLYCISLSTGGELWRENLNGPVVGSPAISNGMLYIGTLNGVLYAFRSDKVAFIKSPDDEEVLINTSTVKIYGCTKNSNFSKYLLYVSSTPLSSVTEEPNDWIFISSSNVSVNDVGFLGTWQTENLLDGIYAIKLIVEETDGSKRVAINYPKLNNPPRPPLNLAAVDLPEDQGGAILLSWVKSPDDAEGKDVIEYRIYRSIDSVYDFSKPLIILPKNTQTYQDTTTTLNTTYYYIIRSYDGYAESVNSNESYSFSVDNTPPQKPSNLISYPGNEYIQLYWEKSPDDQSGSRDVKQYWLFRSTVSQTYDFLKPFVILSNGTSFYFDTEIQLATTYFYTIRAFDGTNFSETSNETSSILIMTSQVIETEKEITTNIYTTANEATILIKSWKDNIINVDFSGEIFGVFIENGTLNNNDVLTIKKFNSKNFPLEVSILLNSIPLETIWETKLSNNNSLNKKILLKIPYNKQINNIKEKYLRVYTIRQNVWSVISDSEIKLDEKRIYTKTNNLSFFRVMQHKSSEEIISKDKVYTYPNPARNTNILYFKFYLDSEAKITIDVYNLAAELIHHKEISFPETEAGKIHEVPWEISNIASGVYIYRIKAEGGGRTNSVTKKLAIVH